MSPWYNAAMRQGSLLVFCTLGKSTRAAVLTVWTAVGLLSASCGSGSGDGARQVRSLEEIKKSGKLIVVTRNAPTTYYVDRDGAIAGMECDMVVSFARHIGVEPEFIGFFP